jgi:hypothetical protein
MKSKSHFSHLLSASLFFSFVAASFAVEAQNLEFQNIRVGGTGCPSDITQIITAPDRSSASILFQSFESHVPVIASGPKVIPYLSSLNCNLFIDIKLPANQKLESLEISYDMRGHAFLDRGVNGNFKSYLISSNGLGTERVQKTQLLQMKEWMNAESDQDDDFLVQSTKSLRIQSNCGVGSRNDLVTVHLQHQLSSQILEGHRNSNASGTITMDSSDMKGGIKLRAIGKACQNTQSPGNGNGRNCRIVRVLGRSQMICE